MERNKPDNVFPLTKKEILEHFPHVFHNNFQTRTMWCDPFNLWTNESYANFFCEGYTKGHSTAAILINKDDEKDYFEFWTQYKNGRVQHCYSMHSRDHYPTILN